jgi:hypothetical protein
MAYSHVQGLATILTRFSTPQKTCSNELERRLLQWYFLLEDHCCLVSVFPPCLHITWRRENIRVRQRLWTDIKRSNDDGKGANEFEQNARLSNESGGLNDDLNPRVLDDILQELWIHVPTLADALQEFHKLKELEGDELRDRFHNLNLLLKEVQSAMMELWNSERVTELLRDLDPTGWQPRSTSSQYPPSPKEQTHPYHTSSQQSTLSASPIPYRCKFRLAGYFRLTFLSIKSYIPIILQRIPRPQPLRTNHSETNGEKTATCFQDHKTLRLAADEMCGIYAGLEYFPFDLLMPCSYPLTMACFSCSPELREWLWLKFERFEESGVFFGPLKTALMTLRDYLPEELGKVKEVQKRLLVEDTAASTRN